MFMKYFDILHLFDIIFILKDKWYMIAMNTEYTFILHLIEYLTVYAGLFRV